MLIYTSRAVLDINQKLLEDILNVAVVRNKRDDITGFLVARSGYFLQLIEGDEAKVRALYKDIQNDKRHHRITLQGEAQAQTRIMPDWSMGLIPNDRKVEETESILSLFELGRRGEIYSDKASLETILRLFAKNANPLTLATFEKTH